MALDSVMKGLMQSATQSEGPAAGGDPLSEALEGLMGGGSQGGSQGDQMLGALEGIIGGRPGSGQRLPKNDGSALNTGQMGGAVPP
jgi:hypothetical protein